MDLLVYPENDCWVARIGEQRYRCAIGRGGILPAAEKREGDGATPLGRWPLRRLLFRPDRGEAPQTALPSAPLSQRDGWCDDPERTEYNQPINLPFPGHHEVLWRQDGLYDLLVVLGHNDNPPRPGSGSAIFLHCAHEDYAPTEGCVALQRSDLEQVLAQLQPGDAVEVLAEAPAG
ncbi:L,D-transpeptidase family protein [Aquibaculum arenosum]|uniref:L,D-transpeptidase family protein n=1 Tax=Aquibaculum arenosum TaxID=3032591 RepID=A0ABT5YKF7_9PROT|nr:L,D-transpeptidase family protein [Fodinicurvata sp. CAU 1616]MDF2095431.1 L,D-transpeptidase family protein [Fodinicurvata sp. CAU 1616]